MSATTRSGAGSVEQAMLVANDPIEDRAQLELFHRFQETGSRRHRDELIAATQSIAEACARRFVHRGEPLDDLTQVALVGLVKAVDRFDPTRGIPFAGFAVPTIMGELRRHFRDATWAVHVPRGAKDLHVRLPAVTEALQVRLGRVPTPAELAADLGVSLDEVLQALDAGSAYRPRSLDTPAGEHLAARRSQPADDVEPEDRVLLRKLVKTLDGREREIVWLRFFEDLSQAEIAEIVGTSQVHVSRLLRRSLRELRELAGPTAPGESVENA